MNVHRRSEDWIPKNLVQQIAEGNCVVFVGAGLSQGAGLPNWTGLLHQMLDWAADHGVDMSDREELERYMAEGKLLMVAEEMRERLGKDDLLKFMVETFCNPGLEPTDAHKLIPRINFSAALTSNYDTLLERAYTLEWKEDPPVFTHSDVPELSAALRSDEFYILKVYGHIDRIETMILGRSDYREIIHNNPAYHTYLTTLLSSKTMLFVGFSLTDPDLMMLLDELGSIFKHYTGKHYALMNTKGVGEIERRRFERDYNIRIIPYTPVAPDNREIGDFLGILEQPVGMKTNALRKQRLIGSMAIENVVLENIGPFDRLELELDKHWNILLGDNGVGKSSILKAIALSICGMSGQGYAHRIIKLRENKAKIQLETARGGRYVTNLYRSGGEVRIASLPEQPLEVGNWLALGFPPLRSIGWQQSLGPRLEDDTLLPQPADLLPLVSSDPDPRIRDLKQWIINLDYQVSKETNARNKRLLDDFFYVVGILTERMRLELGELNPETSQITVVTDDGIVPIELISQGTQSLIGWIGVLLQRLYEAYSESEEPREQYALVLIDEIDAHMHPSWQQSIVPILSELFPNVQFFATTHSPLIVAELRKEQVFLLSRDYDVNSEIKPVLVRKPDENFINFRADQILTSSLFGLARSRGSKAIEDTERYVILLGKRERSAQEENEFKELQNKLQETYTSSDSPMGRQVEQAIQETLAKMELKPPAGKDSAEKELSPEMVMEIKRQLKELLGS